MKLLLVKIFYAYAFYVGETKNSLVIRMNYLFIFITHFSTLVPFN
jgi:hypothetical protein